MNEKPRLSVCGHCDNFREQCYCPGGGWFYSRGNQTRKNALYTAAAELRKRADALVQRANTETE